MIGRFILALLVSNLLCIGYWIYYFTTDSGATIDSLAKGVPQLSHSIQKAASYK